MVLGSLGLSMGIWTLIKPRVPIYAASSWTSIVSLKAAQFLDPIRDIYEVRDIPDE